MNLTRVIARLCRWIEQMEHERETALHLNQSVTAGELDSAISQFRKELRGAIIARVTS